MALSNRTEAAVGQFDTSVALQEVSLDGRQSVERFQYRPLLSRTKKSADDHGQIEGERRVEPRIRGIGVALPNRYYSQSELVRLLKYEGDSVAERMFVNNGMDGRYMVLSPEDFAKTKEPGFQQSLFQKESIRLGVQACQSLVRDSGVDIGTIDCVVSMTTYGFVVPAMSGWIAADLGLRESVSRFDLNGSGCCGSVTILDAAKSFLASKPGGRVLIVASEIGSQFMRRWPSSNRGAMVINALMGDAAIAVLLDDSCADGNRASPSVVDTEYSSECGRLDAVTIRISEDGTMDGYISKDLPTLAGPLYQSALERLLGRNGMTQDDIKHWVFHPGSRAIIESVRDSLGLTEEQIGLSRETLRKYGNVCSCTALLCLHETIESGRSEPGDSAILGGIGPGMTAGVALIRW